jgi:hypothetical protein
MVNVGIFLGHLLNSRYILYILWSIGIFWYAAPRKIWQPGSEIHFYSFQSEQDKKRPKAFI